MELRNTGLAQGHDALAWWLCSGYVEPGDTSSEGGWGGAFKQREMHRWMESLIRTDNRWQRARNRGLVRGKEWEGDRDQGQAVFLSSALQEMNRALGHSVMMLISAWVQCWAWLWEFCFLVLKELMLQTFLITYLPVSSGGTMRKNKRRRRTGGVPAFI